MVPGGLLVELSLGRATDPSGHTSSSGIALLLLRMVSCLVRCSIGKGSSVLELKAAGSTMDWKELRGSGP